MGAKTSITDTASYKNICQFFIRDEDAFRRFRNYSHDYNRVLEHVKQKKGEEYFDIAIENCPWLIDRLDDIRKNDSVGSPRVFGYRGYGLFSPTTLRYTKVMTDIYNDLGSPDMGDKVIEIGGGYGGQQRILNEFMTFKYYYTVDLEEVCALQEKYLSNFEPIFGGWIYPEGVKSLKTKFDFVISNFAFNELIREYQELYFEKIISKSKHGYISGIFDDVDRMGLEEIEKLLPNTCKIRKYLPDTGFNCHIITW